MKKSLCMCVVVLMGAQSSLAASLPQIPTPMYHVGIGLNGNAVEVHGADPGPAGGVLPLYAYGESYDAPADVLDGQAYNDQYGWVLDGIISKPVDSSFFLKLISKDAGLTTYEGGMRMHRASHTYDVILDQPGDTWAFPESMTHHWNAATTPGLYSLTYEVYLGDSFTQAPLTSYTPDQITLQFEYVPEPASVMFLAFGGASLTRLRRRSEGGA